MKVEYYKANNAKEAIVKNKKEEALDKVMKNQVKSQNKVSLSLQTRYMGRKYYNFEELDSTNEYLKRYEGPFKDGVVVSAEYQTEGRGRVSGRGWHASKGGLSLLFSILLIPKEELERLSELTQVLGLAIANAVEDVCMISTMLKWPNDVYIRDKKVCGVLSEFRFEEDILPMVILGVGLNVNEELKSFPMKLQSKATTLFEETGIRWNKLKILSAILVYFEKYYERWKKEGFKVILEDIALKFYLQNKRVKVVMSGVVICGKVQGLDSRGYLLLKEDRGRVHSIVSGEVVECF